jgi:RecJ-like exonuclease
MGATISTGAVTPIGAIDWRSGVVVRGRVRTMRILPSAGGPTLELTVYDDSGGITAVFTGRSALPGVELGSQVELAGRAGIRRGYLALLNPSLTILSGGPNGSGHP